MSVLTIPKPGSIYNENFAQGSDLNYYSKINNVWVLIFVNPNSTLDSSKIIDPENWDENGEYTGSITGMLAGQTYDDLENKVKYEFNGTTVVRYPINIIES